MFNTLQGRQAAFEATFGTIADELPPAMYDFLTARGSEWDAPLVGEAFKRPPIPGADIFDLRTTEALKHRGTAIKPIAKALDLPCFRASVLPWLSASVLPCLSPEEESGLGSNNWAVAGAHTASGGALVANDMHLAINVPNIWYRASLVFPILEYRVTRCAQPESRCRASPGSSLAATDTSRGASPTPAAIGVTSSLWNPTRAIHSNTSRRQVLSRSRAFVNRSRCTARRPIRSRSSGRFGVQSYARRLMADASRSIGLHTTPIGLPLTSRHWNKRGRLRKRSRSRLRLGIPAQNFVAGDTAGRIGWTIAGPIPLRLGFDGSRPVSWADGSRRWNGYLTAAEHPRVLDPQSGRVWTANAPVVTGDALRSDR